MGITEYHDVAVKLQLLRWFTQAAEGVIEEKASIEMQLHVLTKKGDDVDKNIANKPVQKAKGSGGKPVYHQPVNKTRYYVSLEGRKKVLSVYLKEIQNNITVVDKSLRMFDITGFGAREVAFKRPVKPEQNAAHPAQGRRTPAAAPQQQPAHTAAQPAGLQPSTSTGWGLHSRLSQLASAASSVYNAAGNVRRGVTRAAKNRASQFKNYVASQFTESGGRKTHKKVPYATTVTKCPRIWPDNSDSKLPNAHRLFPDSVDYRGTPSLELLENRIEKLVQNNSNFINRVTSTASSAATDDDLTHGAWGVDDLQPRISAAREDPDFDMGNPDVYSRYSITQKDLTYYEDGVSFWRLFRSGKLAGVICEKRKLLSDIESIRSDSGDSNSSRFYPGSTTPGMVYVTFDLDQGMSFLDLVDMLREPVKKRSLNLDTLKYSLEEHAGDSSWVQIAMQASPVFDKDTVLRKEYLEKHPCRGRSQKLVEARACWDMHPTESVIFVNAGQTTINVESIKPVFDKKWGGSGGQAKHLVEALRAQDPSMAGGRLFSVEITNPKGGERKDRVSRFKGRTIDVKIPGWRLGIGADSGDHMEEWEKGEATNAGEEESELVRVLKKEFPGSVGREESAITETNLLGVFQGLTMRQIDDAVDKKTRIETVQNLEEKDRAALEYGGVNYLKNMAKCARTGSDANNRPCANAKNFNRIQLELTLPGKVLSDFLLQDLFLPCMAKSEMLDESVRAQPSLLSLLKHGINGLRGATGWEPDEITRGDKLEGIFKRLEADDLELGFTTAKYDSPQLCNHLKKFAKFTLVSEKGWKSPQDGGSPMGRVKVDDLTVDLLQDILEDSADTMEFPEGALAVEEEPVVDEAAEEAGDGSAAAGAEGQQVAGAEGPHQGGAEGQQVAEAEASTEGGPPAPMEVEEDSTNQNLFKLGHLEEKLKEDDANFKAKREASKYFKPRGNGARVGRGIDLGRKSAFDKNCSVERCTASDSGLRSEFAFAIGVSADNLHLPGEGAPGGSALKPPEKQLEELVTDFDAIQQTRLKETSDFVKKRLVRILSGAMTDLVLDKSDPYAVNKLNLQNLTAAELLKRHDRFAVKQQMPDSFQSNGGQSMGDQMAGAVYNFHKKKLTARIVGAKRVIADAAARTKPGADGAPASAQAQPPMPEQLVPAAKLELEESERKLKILNEQWERRNNSPHAVFEQSRYKVRFSIESGGAVADQLEAFAVLLETLTERHRRMKLQNQIQADPVGIARGLVLVEVTARVESVNAGFKNIRKIIADQTMAAVKRGRREREAGAARAAGGRQDSQVPPAALQPAEPGAAAAVHDPPLPDPRQDDAAAAVHDPPLPDPRQDDSAHTKKLIQDAKTLNKTFLPTEYLGTGTG